jgi:TonB family protein
MRLFLTGKQSRTTDPERLRCIAWKHKDFDNQMATFHPFINAFCDARLVKCLFVFVIFLMEISFASAQATPSSPVPRQSRKGKALALYAPPPKYPKDAEGRHPTGSGIVVMEIDQQTGWVKSAKMEKSTGNKLLDDAALQAFSHWRFRPSTPRRVHSPITFTMSTMGGARHRMAGAVISH